MLNINFLRNLVIILAIAILSLITVIVIKIVNGDISKSNKSDFEHHLPLSTKVKNFKLTIPIGHKIEKVFANGNVLTFLTKDENNNYFLIVSQKEKIEIIKILNGDSFKYEEIN